MTDPVSTRRVVVENDAHGRSTVVSDEVLVAAAVGAPVEQDVPIRGCELWVTDSMPVDNSPATRPEQQAGCLERFHDLFVGNGAGSAFRVTELAPGHPRVAHRTQTIDYDLVLAGEVDLVVEEGEPVHLTAGDTAVVRGTTHEWVNRSATTSAVVAFVMIDARPVMIDGRPVGTHYPSDADPSS